MHKYFRELEELFQKFLILLNWQFLYNTNKYSPNYKFIEIEMFFVPALI